MIHVSGDLSTTADESPAPASPQKSSPFAERLYTLSRRQLACSASADQLPLAKVVWRPVSVLTSVKRAPQARRAPPAHLGREPRLRGAAAAHRSAPTLKANSAAMAGGVDHAASRDLPEVYHSQLVSDRMQAALVEKAESVSEEIVLLVDINPASATPYLHHNHQPLVLDRAAHRG